MLSFVISKEYLGQLYTLLQEYPDTRLVFLSSNNQTLIAEYLNTDLKILGGYNLTENKKL